MYDRQLPQHFLAPLTFFDIVFDIVSDFFRHILRKFLTNSGCRKMSETAEQCRKMPKNAENLPKNAEKCRSPLWGDLYRKN